MTQKYILVREFLSKEEAKSLELYAKKALILASFVDGIGSYPLGNRPDSWSDGGYIEKIFRVSLNYFDKNRSGGVLESVKFFFRELVTGSKIMPTVERDTSRDAQVHKIDRKIAILGLNDDYEGGTTTFTNTGDTIKLGAGDLLMYGVDESNEVGVSEVISGNKLELVLWYSEIHLKTRFDEFYMPPMEDDSDRF
jgi:hypothetical protein